MMNNLHSETVALVSILASVEHELEDIIADYKVAIKLADDAMENAPYVPDIVRKMPVYYNIIADRLIEVCASISEVLGSVGASEEQYHG